MNSTKPAKSMKFVHFVVWTTVLLGSAWAQPAKVNIAVQELKGKGMDQSTASIISDRLRAECINTGVFRVMERAEMENILKEQGFQQTGACDEASCLVEVGQLLGVDRMVAGSIGKVGNFYTISLRMINVATGEILYTVNVDHKGSIEDVISEAICEAAGKLARSAGGDVSRAYLSGKKGDLHITSEVPEATVTIDGKSIRGKSPITLQGFPAGEYKIVAKKSNYFGSRTVTLEPDDLLKVHVPMSKGNGSLKVFTKPAGAIVIVDGANEGESPVKVSKVPVGEHEVVLRLEGYVTEKGMVSVGIDETATFSADMVPAGYITVSVKPASAAILLNGKKVGRGKITDYEVPAGEVKVQVQTPGYDVHRQTVHLLMGQGKKLEVQLTSSFGTLAVQTKPPGAMVFLNDKEGGQTPYENNRLIPGKYRIRTEQEGYDTHDTLIDISKAERKTLELDLVSKFAKLEISTDPKGAHVFLNGKHAGQTPYSNNELDPGSYELRIRLDHYGEINETLEPAKDQYLKRAYTLEHTREYLDSLAAAEEAAYRRIRWIRRIAFGSLAAAFCGGGLYFEMESNDSYDRYMAYEGYDEDKHQKNWDEIEQAHLLRNILYAAAGACGLGLAVSIRF